MTAEPVVTIITPTYNHGRFISQCIDSVLNQTFSDWEMLVINDGSTDNTAEIVAGFAEADSRITLFNQSNIGIFRLSETYNFALGKARGKFIAVLEGDDLWEPDKLERQVKVLNANPEIVLAWSPARQVNVDRSEVFLTPSEISPEDIGFFSNDPPGSILNILFFRNCIPALTVLIRKEALTGIGGFHQGYDLPLVDVPTWQNLTVCGKFHYDPIPTGSWRVYPDQTTKTHLVRIFSGFRTLSLDNYTKFSQKGTLSFGVTSLDINRHFDRMMIMAYSREGRYMLIRKQFRQARERYTKAITGRGGEYMWKIRALTGLILSFLHLDVEWLARMLGRPSYKK